MSATPFSLELPSSGWLQKLKDDDRQLLSSYGEFIPGHPGSPIIKEGEIQSHLYLVIKGHLTVNRSGDTGSHLIAEIPPGESIAEMSIFDPVPASATVVPSEFSQLWRIDKDALLRFIEENPVTANQFLIALVTTMAQRLRRHNSLVTSLYDQAQSS